MIEYIILTPSLLKVDNDEIAQDKPIYVEVARYDFDLGLQLKEKVGLQDVRYGDKTFSFTGAVVDVFKSIKPNKQKVDKNDKVNKDTFCIEVIVEMDDKENMEEIRDIIMELNPGKFKE